MTLHLTDKHYQLSNTAFKIYILTQLNPETYKWKVKDYAKIFKKLLQELYITQKGN